jgi:hypothetical protein
MGGYLYPGAPVAPKALDVGRSLVAELLFTFALVYVVLNVMITNFFMPETKITFKCAAAKQSAPHSC